MYTEEKLKNKSLCGFRREIVGAIAVREQQDLRRKSASTDGLQVYENLCEGIGLNGCPRGLVDSGTFFFLVKVRTGGVNLKERRNIFGDEVVGTSEY